MGLDAAARPKYNTEPIITFSNNAEYFIVFYYGITAEKEQ